MKNNINYNTGFKRGKECCAWAYKSKIQLLNDINLNKLLIDITNEMNNIELNTKSIETFITGYKDGYKAIRTLFPHLIQK